MFTGLHRLNTDRTNDNTDDNTDAAFLNGFEASLHRIIMSHFN